MLTVLAGLAEFERELVRSRTGEGRERAKARVCGSGVSRSSPRISDEKHLCAVLPVNRLSKSAGFFFLPFVCFLVRFSSRRPPLDIGALTR
jgi:hypothetical protein